MVQSLRGFYVRSMDDVKRFASQLELMYELGRQLQAVPLIMRKHQIIGEQQLCKCGRLPLRSLPDLGLRCEVASAHWAAVHEAMRRMVRHTDARPIGRATVPRS